jgi:exodeoxyribonuclease-5/exodeoxyribonuclease V alpha subunit
MLSRPLVYTAMTRAARHLSVVPVNGPALRLAVRQAGGRRRRTLLPSWLAGADGSGADDGVGDGLGEVGDVGDTGSGWPRARAPRREPAGIGGRSG